MTRIATVLFALSLSTTAMAQAQKGSLYGTVIDVDAGIAFVVDTSCSMDWDHGTHGTALSDTISEVTASVQSLPTGTEFNLVAYDDKGSWSFSEGPVPADRISTQEAAAWLSDLRAGGPDIDDDFGPALIAALSDNPDTMAFAIVTDGGYDMAAQVGPIGLANVQGASIYVFGWGLQGKDRTAAQKVARENSGEYVDLP